jgi:hypothetical protein
MTSVGATASVPGYASILASAQRQPQAVATTGHSGRGQSATTVTLSEAAKAALEGKDFPTVIAEARATLDRLLAEAELEEPSQENLLALDLSKVDRRELFAVASNAELQFTADEQKAAGVELQRRFDAALVGPTAVARVTDDITGLYSAALAYLEAMSPEEKASAAYADQKTAIEEALRQLEIDPKTFPTGIANDPVDAYLDRVAAGEIDKRRDFTDIADDARHALDKQYADARAAGKELIFDTSRKVGQRVDFSQFDSRTLSAIVLNSGDGFSRSEVQAATAEMRVRSSAALTASFKNASASGDPTAFALNIISQFASMSGEERQAAGWSDNFYRTVLSNYESTARITSMMSTATGGGTGMSLLDYL